MNRLAPSVALFLLFGCAVEAPPQPAMSEAPATATEGISFELRSNCTGWEAPALVWAVEEWEAAVPNLDITLVLTDEKPNVLCPTRPLASLPLDDEGNLVGGHAYPSHVEIYSMNFDGDEDLARLVFTHELGHFIFDAPGHVEDGCMEPTIFGESGEPNEACISQEDLEHVCQGRCSDDAGPTC